MSNRPDSIDFDPSGEYEHLKAEIARLSEENIQQAQRLLEAAGKMPHVSVDMGGGVRVLGIQGPNQFDPLIMNASLTWHIRDLQKELAAFYDFSPTPDQVNALPEKLRSYIHLLETRADPAGDVASLVCAQENVEALTNRVLDLEKENSELADDRRLFIPGQWRCPKCEFALSRQTLSVNTGEVGVTRADMEEPENCPNDGTPMVRESWQDRAVFMMKAEGIKMTWICQEAERLELENKRLQEQLAGELRVNESLSERHFEAQRRVTVLTGELANAKDLIRRHAVVVIDQTQWCVVCQRRTREQKFVHAEDCAVLRF
jgi:rubrerythrin